MIAVGRDENESIYPLAFAICEGENHSSWSWFLWRLHYYMARDRMRIGIISNRHKEILAAVSDESIGWTVLYGYHRLYLRRIEINLNDRFYDAIF